MKSIEYIVCKRCGVKSIKSPLYRDEMCDRRFYLLTKNHF